MIKFKQWIIPFITLLIAFLLDGTISAVFSEQLTIGSGVMFTRLLFVSLVYYSFRLPLEQVVVYAAFFGLLQDSYYVGILGIYITAYVLIVYLASVINKSVDDNILTIGLSTAVLLAAFELIVYMLYSSIGFVHLGVRAFIVLRFAPTLLFNMLAYFVCYYVLKISANGALR